MTMFSSVKTQSNFLRLINKYGKTYTVDKYTKTDVLVDPLRPSKGYVTTSTSTDVIGYASTYDRKLINSESLIEITDFPLYISGSNIGFSSDKSDKIAYGSETYSIVNITKYEVCSDIIYYELQLRS